MERKMLSRVIMLPDSSVHIALRDGNTIDCSLRSLSELLSNPTYFIEYGQFNYLNTTTKNVNPDNVELKNIPGLTLVKIFEDLTTIWVFPQLYDILLNQSEPDRNAPIKLLAYVKESEVSDVKHFLLKFFYEFSNALQLGFSEKYLYTLDDQFQKEMVGEIYNSVLLQTPIRKQEEEAVHAKTESRKNTTMSKPELSRKPSQVKQNKDIPDGMIPATEFASRNDIPITTLYSYLKSKKIRDSILLNGHWYINPNAVITQDGRKGRKMPPRSETGIKPYMSDPDKKVYTHTELQRYIAEKEGVSSEIRTFIKSYDEIVYYRENYYREIVVNGRPALVLDINPEYYCKRLGKTNRQLIEDGRSPVVADDDANRSDDDTVFEYWELHHIGQRENSPFCTLPTTPHRIEHDKMFHPDADPSQDLHGPNFATHKSLFWNKYLELYDKYGGVSRIPGVNLRTQYKKLNKAQKQTK